MTSSRLRLLSAAKKRVVVATMATGMFAAAGIGVSMLGSTTAQAVSNPCPASEAGADVSVCAYHTGATTFAYVGDTTQIQIAAKTITPPTGYPYDRVACQAVSGVTDIQFEVSVNGVVFGPTGADCTSLTTPVFATAGDMSTDSAIDWIEFFGNSPTVTSSSPAPSSSSPAACEQNSQKVGSYTFDGRQTWTVIVQGSQPLCTPVYASGVGWIYVSPTGMWPQNHPTTGNGVVKIEEPGTYTIKAPRACQIDAYARSGKAPEWPNELQGPNNPYEPAFINAFFSGSDKVWDYVSPADCIKLQPTTSPSPSPSNTPTPLAPTVSQNTLSCSVAVPNVSVVTVEKDSIGYQKTGTTTTWVYREAAANTYHLTLPSVGLGGSANWTIIVQPADHSAQPFTFNLSWSRPSNCGIPTTPVVVTSSASPSVSTSPSPGPSTVSTSPSPGPSLVSSSASSQGTSSVSPTPNGGASDQGRYDSARRVQKSGGSWAEMMGLVAAVVAAVAALFVSVRRHRRRFNGSGA